MAMTSPQSPIDRLLEPLVECLTPEAARRIVDFRVDAQTQQRLDEWAEKSNEGQLTPGEKQEYRSFVAALDFVGVMQAKARQSLGARSDG